MSHGSSDTANDRSLAAEISPIAMGTQGGTIAFCTVRISLIDSCAGTPQYFHQRPPSGVIRSSPTGPRGLSGGGLVPTPNLGTALSRTCQERTRPIKTSERGIRESPHPGFGKINNGSGSHRSWNPAPPTGGAGRHGLS